MRRTEDSQRAWPRLETVVAVRLATAELLAGDGREIDAQRLEDSHGLAHQMRRLPRVAPEVEQHID